jgi:hypothetical protein
MEQMTVQEVINLILSTYSNAFQYMLPIVAVMAGINWIVGFLIFTTFGLERRTFGR